jgi:hypothetical protein
MNQHVPIGTALVAKPSFPKTNLDLDIARGRSPTTSTLERKREVRLFALWPFILVVAIPCDDRRDLGRSADSSISVISEHAG